ALSAALIRSRLPSSISISRPIRARRSSRLGWRSAWNAARWALNAACSSAIAGSSLVLDGDEVEVEVEAEVEVEVELSRMDMGTSRSRGGSYAGRGACAGTSPDHAAAVTTEHTGVSAATTSAAAVCDRRPDW